MQVCQQLLPGYGEEQILNGLPNEVRAFLSAAIEEEPWFLHEYLLPTLAGLDGGDKIIEDLSWALAEIEVEEEIYGVDPDDYEWVGDQGLGFLGKSMKKRLKKKLKKVVKKVVAPIKKTVEVAKKIAAPIKKIQEKIKAPIKKIDDKIKQSVKHVAKRVGSAVQRGGTRFGRALHRTAKSGKLQIALAPFTLGVSLAFHPKVAQAGKKFMAGPYGNVVIGALGAIFAIPTGGASVAAAAALTTANTMYQKKKAAEAAKAAQKANANELAAEANQLQSEAEQQLNDFYTQNAQYFQQYGVTQSMWNGMSFDEKVALLDAAAAGTLPIVQPPPSQGAPPSGPGYTPPPSGGDYAPSPSGGGYAPPAGGGGYAPSGGGGGGGGGSDPYYTSGGGAPGQPGQPGAARAGFSELLGPAAIGIGILAVMMQSKKKGRTRRNPGRRRTRWSA